MGSKERKEECYRINGMDVFLEEELLFPPGTIFVRSLLGWPLSWRSLLKSHSLHRNLPWAANQN